MFNGTQSIEGAESNLIPPDKAFIVFRWIRPLKANRFGTVVDKPITRNCVAWNRRWTDRIMAP